jgi:anti-anti-sigma factor
MMHGIRDAMAIASISQAHATLSAWEVLHLTGDVDLAAAPGLHQLLERPIADPACHIVVDLSAVTFMDCSGLRPLLDAQALIGDRLRLRGLPRQVTRLLDLTGLHGAFDVIDDGTSFPLTPSNS